MARALTPAPYLRRAFTVDQPVASARLYVTALGLYEARLNGRRVGDGYLTPGWTDYARRIAYQAYDVTKLLNQGGNVLGAILADGWYAGFYGFDPNGPAPTTALRRNCWPSWCCGWPTAASSGSSPMGSGSPRLARSGMRTC